MSEIDLIILSLSLARVYLKKFQSEGSKEIRYEMSKLQDKLIEDNSE